MKYKHIIMKVRYNQIKYLSTWDINEFQQKLRDTNRPFTLYLHSKLL